MFLYTIYTDKIQKALKDKKTKQNNKFLIFISYLCSQVLSINTNWKRMLKLIQRLLTIVFILHPVMGIKGQVLTANTMYRTLTYRDGLTGTSVTDIISDHKGEIWLATNNGVNSYNGKRLVAYV